jgi:hypothetical protein
VEGLIEGGDAKRGIEKLDKLKPEAATRHFNAMNRSINCIHRCFVDK